MAENTIEGNSSISSRITLTARLSVIAYDAIAEIQRNYRQRTGKHKPIWKIIDTAIILYAKQQGIKIGE